jgi:hypothetical protein
MRVPDEILSCVVFLGYEVAPGELQFAGTAFFVTKQLEGFPDSDVVYIVTAKHVIEGIRQQGAPYVYLRMNTVAGGASLLRTDSARWKSDPGDPFLDVAVLAWAPPREDLDYRAIGESMLAVDQVIQAQGIGVGDDAFLTGLFVNHFGKQRNIPIVRVGNIAAMPSEPVQTRIFGTEVAIDAYLLEARSIGGLSGSPVFVVTSGIRGNEIRVGPQFFLLGLMHGHWDANLSAADAVIPDGLRDEAVNMGIAIVIPVSKIMEVINHPDFLAQRKRYGEQIEELRRRQAGPRDGDSLGSGAENE